MNVYESRILIVDDIEENLKVLTETLTQNGFKPLQAKSGARAVEIAAKALPDLILLDIKMPGMDGFQTIAQLKSDAQTRDIPVIFISALSDIEDKVRGFQAGAVDYVSKPFREEEVLARVTTHLKLRLAMRAVEAEQEKSDRLLLNILPPAVAQELKDHGASAPQFFDNVSILFTDFCDFTSRTEALPPQQLIEELNDMFTEFDKIMERWGCQRIKTIGDAYLAVCGMPEKLPDHASRLTAAALDIARYLDERNASSGQTWQVRAGIHSGQVVGAIVGTKKYLYDIFGDAVNTASRMEACSEPMKVNVSADTWAQIQGDFQGTERGRIEVKGKGSLPMYFVSSKNGQSAVI